MQKQRRICSSSFSPRPLYRRFPNRRRLADPRKLPALEFIAVFEAILGIYVLFRKNFDEIFGGAAGQLATELDVHDLRIIVLEDHILHINGFEELFPLLAVLDVAVQLAVFGDWMSPKLLPASGLLTDFQLDAFLLFILRKLHEFSCGISGVCHKNAKIRLRLVPRFKIKNPGAVCQTGAGKRYSEPESRSKK